MFFGVMLAEKSQIFGIIAIQLLVCFGCELNTDKYEGVLKSDFEEKLVPILAKAEMNVLRLMESSR